MTIKDRRRALMAAKKTNDDILWEWKPADGLSALTYGGTNTTPPVLSTDGVKVYGGPSGKYTYISLPVTYDGSFEVAFEVGPHPTGTGWDFNVRTSFNGITSRCLRNATKWRVDNGGTPVDYSTPAYPSNGVTIKGVYNKSANKVSWYADTKLIGENTPGTPSTSKLAFLIETAISSECELLIKHIAVRKV